MSRLHKFNLKSAMGKHVGQLLERQLVDLLTEIEEFIGEVEVMLAMPSLGPGLDRLRSSLTEFHLFSFDYFKYIQEATPTNYGNQAQALGKIQHELLALRPLVDQRRAPHLAKSLRVADAIAYALVERCGLASNTEWTNLNWKGLERFLVFFEDVHLIRQGTISYYRVPAVGIPLSAWRSPWAWLGLAHEVGHHIYRNLIQRASNATPQTLGAWLEESLLDKLSKNMLGAGNLKAKAACMMSLPLWHEWLEEVFADVFGALVLGPSFIESLIAVLLPGIHSSESLLENDHDHPPSFLRPLIQIEAFKAMLQRIPPNAGERAALEKDIGEIHQSWMRLSAELITEDGQATHTALKFWRRQFVQGSVVRIGDCIDTIPLVIDTILEGLSKYKSRDGFYSPADHDHIKAMASQLARGRRPGQADNFTLAQVLPAAWYAHKSIAQKRAAVAEALQAKQDIILDWIENISVLEEERDYGPDPRKAAVMANRGMDGDQAEEPALTPVFDLLQLSAAERPQSQSFLDLFARLKQQLEDDGQDPGETCGICQLLLEIEFSTEESHSSKCPKCCPGTLSKSCS